MVKPGVDSPIKKDANAEIGRMVTQKNMCALIACYFGVFSAIPCVGVFLGIPAVLFGVRGLKFHRNSERANGKVQSWIGIVAGIVFTLVWTGLAIVLIFRVLVESQ